MAFGAVSSVPSLLPSRPWNRIGTILVRVCAFALAGMEGAAVARALRPQYRVLHFFFSSRRRHTRLQGDWSSDVCSSDLSLRKIPARQKTPTTSPYVRRRNQALPRVHVARLLSAPHRGAAFPPELPGDSARDRKSVV